MNVLDARARSPAPQRAQSHPGEDPAALRTAESAAARLPLPARRRKRGIERQRPSRCDVDLTGFGGRQSVKLGIARNSACKSLHYHN